jgi:membrane-associated phospholipid phosphatase
MNYRLPAIDHRKKWLWAAIGYIIFCLLYTLTGNLHMRAPARLTPSPVDELIPFTNWAIWLYHSQLVFLLLSVYALKKQANLSDMFYSMVLACLLSFAIFTIYPTTIPRIVQTDNGLTAKAFQFLYSIDNVTNCFPSLHVSLAWLAATALLREKRFLGALAITWAFFISLSTLATKQHYFVDVIGGLAVAVVSRLAVAKLR